MLNFKVTKNPVENQAKIVEAFLNKMAYASHAGSYSVLLSGNPGTGKTSFLRTLGSLLGVDILIIEGSSVIQEHLINIPFLVYEPNSDVPHGGTITQTEQDGQFHVAFSKSYLLQGLKGVKKVSDDDYIDYIYKQNAHIIKLYEALGGTKEEAPEELVDARDIYTDILFIDEYFRAPKNIRNSLRGILNRQIGETPIPKTTFIAFASNLEDEGVSEISSHQVYTKLEMDNPGKDQWFSWFNDKYENSEVRLQDEVLNKFYDIIEDEHMSHNDIENEIRTSPRRWEQLLLMVNDSIPVKNINDANALLANVKANFTNTDKQYSKLHEGVYNAVKELIKETTGDKIADSEMADLGKVEHDKWSDHLKHQIERKINLGEHRSYVPVISGAPGIGKNAKIMQVAHELNLGVIMINSTDVDKDDVVGIPLTKGKPKKGQPIEMKFHTPKLLHVIEEKARKLDESMNFADSAKMKYIIYFDELDKVKDVDVFNALRRVILEKKFANGEPVPDKSVMVAAINPSGTEGSLKFTGHMADVVDIIHSEPNWKEFIKHLTDMNLPEKVIKYRSKLQDLLEVFGNKFKSEGKQGYWNIEANGVQLYVSPRDYTNMFQDSLVAYGRIVKKVEKEETDDLKVFNDKIKDAVYEVYTHGLGAMFDKANMNSQDFFSKLKIWFRSPDTDMLLKDVTMRKSASKNEVKKVFEKMIKDKKYNPVNGEDDASQAYIAYMDSVDATEFASHLREFVEDYIKDGEKSEFPLHKPKHNYTDDTGNDIPTNEIGLLAELKHGFVSSSDNSSKKTLEVYLEALMENKKFKKHFQDFIKEFNSDESNELKIPETTNVKELLKEVYSDESDKQKNPVTTRAKAIKGFIETKEKDKYIYLDYLVNVAEDFVGKPLTTSTTHKNVHELLHDVDGDKPVEDFLKRIEDSIDELDLGGQFKDTLDRELGDELRKLEDEYLLKHIKTWA